MRTRELPTADDLSGFERGKWCNGMGPKAGPGLVSRLWCAFLRLLIKVTGLAALFDSCGDTHDLHYLLGGDEDDWLYYDLVFLGNMLAIKKKAPWPLHPVINFMSFAAFKGVRTGGGFGPFQWRDKALTLEELRAAVRRGEIE